MSRVHIFKCCFGFYTALIYSIVSELVYYGSLLAHFCVWIFLINILDESKQTFSFLYTSGVLD